MTFSDFTNKVKETKAFLLSMSAIIGAVIYMMNYFTPAEAFNEHVRKQELEKLRNITIQYEINYKCYRESCRDKMPPELYIQYQKFLAQIRELEGK